MRIAIVCSKKNEFGLHGRHETFSPLENVDLEIPLAIDAKPMTENVPPTLERFQIVQGIGPPDEEIA